MPFYTKLLSDMSLGAIIANQNAMDYRIIYEGEKMLSVFSISRVSVEQFLYLQVKKLPPSAQM